MSEKKTSQEEDLKTLLNNILSEAFCTEDRDALVNIKRLIHEYEEVNGFVSIYNKSKISLSVYEQKTMEEAEELCCRFFKIAKPIFRSKYREEENVIARHTFCWLMDKHHAFKGARIAFYLGGRNHATVLNAIYRTRDRIETEHPTAIRILEMEEIYIQHLAKKQKACPVDN